MSEYYIWNIAAGRVDGPYTWNEGSIMVNIPQGYDLFHLSGNHVELYGMYPLKDENTGEYQIVRGTEISDEYYKQAIPVSSDCIFVETLDGKKAVVYEDLDNVILLPKEAELATEPNGDTILLKIGNKWQLWMEDGNGFDQ